MHVALILKFILYLRFLGFKENRDHCKCLHVLAQYMDLSQVHQTSSHKYAKHGTQSQIVVECIAQMLPLQLWDCLLRNLISHLMDSTVWLISYVIRYVNLQKDEAHPESLDMTEAETPFTVEEKPEREAREPAAV